MKRNISEFLPAEELVDILRNRITGKVSGRQFPYDDLLKLVQKAQAHGITWLVCDSFLKAYEKTSAESIFLQQEMRKISIEALKKCSDLHKINETALSLEINPVFYKGAALSAIVYGSPSARKYQDNDVLVESFEDACRLRDSLIKNGFRSVENLPDGYEGFKQQNHIEFQLRSNSGYGVDIHWKLFHDYFVPAKIWSEIAGREGALCTIEVAGRKITTLSPTEHLLVLCLHHSTHCWNELRLVADIASLINSCKDIDYAWLFGCSNRCGVRRMVMVGLLLASFLGAKLPEKILFELQNDRLSRRLAGKIWNRLRSGETAVSKGEIMLFETVARDDWASRLVFILKAILSPSDNDLRFLVLPPGFSFFYFFIRPVRQLGQFIRAFLQF